MEIDPQKIQAELQDLAGQATKVRVRTNKSQAVACSSRETDSGISISLNPNRIRNPEKLESYLNDFRKDLTWGQ